MSRHVVSTKSGQVHSVVNRSPLFTFYFSRFFKDQTRINPTEPKRVAQHELRLRLAALAADVVEVAGRVRGLQIHGGRQPAMPEGQRANGGLDRAARSQRVAVIALGAAQGQPVGVIPEYLLDGRRLGRIVERSRRAVGVDVPDLVRLKVRVP